MNKPDLRGTIDGIFAEAEDATQIHEWKWVQDTIDDAIKIVPKDEKFKVIVEKLEELDTEIEYQIDALRDVDIHSDEIKSIINELEEELDNEDLS